MLLLARQELPIGERRQQLQKALNGNGTRNRHACKLSQAVLNRFSLKLQLRKPFIVLFYAHFPIDIEVVQPFPSSIESRNFFLKPFYPHDVVGLV